MKREDKMCWGKNIGLFYGGLFNFYSFASVVCKKQFLAIVEQ